jgi:hypothetical protein
MGDYYLKLALFRTDTERLFIRHKHFCGKTLESKTLKAIAKCTGQL